MPEPSYITIEGARVHNLKNISLQIPRNALTVITGLSGSGKSSLAFDTLFSEGQRRYLETLSAYARQFMGTLERPDVDYISGLSPIIAIEQKTTNRNPRSTVGTLTEINDFLRLLFARAATAYSPATGAEMIKYTQPQIAETILQQYENKKLLILAPLVKGRKGHYKELFEQLIRKGFTQARINGELREIGANLRLDRYKQHFIEVVIDKIIPSTESQPRLLASVATALHHGKGTLQIVEAEKGEPRFLIVDRFGCFSDCLRGISRSVFIVALHHATYCHIAFLRNTELPDKLGPRPVILHRPCLQFLAQLRHFTFPALPIFSFRVILKWHNVTVPKRILY